ncbi:MAG TPA: IS110 family transposase, partial [Gammaproteobacteria bacterium]|nr:IS110 family transposase [Gammaproteobacteria bacterium]
LPQKKGNRRGPGYAYNVKELRHQEARVAEHAEECYEHFVATWRTRPPRKGNGCATASNRQGLDGLPGDASSLCATLRHEVGRTAKE